MKTKPFALILLTLGLCLCIACRKEKNSPQELDYEYFKTNLSFDMNLDELIKTFGQPHNDIGSGIHIYIYELNDGTRMVIGYIDSILYAMHVDKEENVLHILIDCREIQKI